MTPATISGTSTNHQARGGRPPAFIWLLLQAGKRPKEKPLGRGSTGDDAPQIECPTAVVTSATRIPHVCPRMPEVRTWDHCSRAYRADAYELLTNLTDRRDLGDVRLVECKFDGERCIVHKDGGDVQLESRIDKDLTDSYPDVPDAVADQRDAELVRAELPAQIGFAEWTNEGRPRFLGLRDDKRPAEVVREQPG